MDRAAMSLTRQLSLLLWKNYVLRKRRILATMCEMALPLLFACILVFLRWNMAPGIDEPDTRFEEEELAMDIQYRHIAYVPQDSEVAEQVARSLQQFRPFFGNLSVLRFETEQQLENNVTNSDWEQEIFAVVFEESSPREGPPPRRVSYHLRLPYLEDWDTNSLFPQYPSHDPGLWERERMTVYRDFLALQHLVDRAIMRYYNETSADSLWNRTAVHLAPFPVPAYRNDPFSAYVSYIAFPLLPVLAFYYAAVRAAWALVQEKDSRLREYMRIMGVSNWLYLSAWFLSTLLCLSVSVVPVVALLHIRIVFRWDPTDVRTAVLHYSDPTLVLVFLLACAVATISFSFMVSAFFSRAHVAAWAAALIYPLSYLPHAFLDGGQKTSACLFSNVAMATGAEVFVAFEAKGLGVHWSGLFESASADRDATLAWALGMLLLDTLLYILVAWYVEAIFPGKYGVPLPYHFFALASYWRGSPCGGNGEEEGEVEVSRSADRREFMEDEPTGLVAGVAFKRLTKEFVMGGIRRQAVRDLTVNMFEGQITVLLGHNGAGKTTTLSMLTGLIPPTRGRALVNGYDIRSDMALVRRSLGFCPQHDILFDDMTVSEHLLFYAQLKGLPRDWVLTDVERMLAVLNLRDKRNALARTLSGGMKRKLSIGVALSGGSRVVLLDEPTAGMDVLARRAVWNLLQGEKRGRTVAITTHFMDEADRLGDRVAIMSGGELQCCGSPLFLKSKYGTGYCLAIAKDLHTCNVSEITRRIRAHVPGATLESNVGTELSYTLPKESAGRFEALFAELEGDRERLGVTSYGASITTMEEVFLRVGKLAEDSSETPPAPQNQKMTAENAATPAGANQTLSSEDTELNTGFRLCVQQFYAMFLKRALYTWRNQKLAVAQFLVPLAFMIPMAMFVAPMPDPIHPHLRLDLSRYGHTRVPMSVVAHDSDWQATSLAEAYASGVSESGTEIVQVNDVNEYLLAQGRKGVNINSGYVVGTVFRESGGFTNATAYYNGAGYHTMATSLAMVDNALFKHVAGHDASIRTGNLPLPRSLSENSSRNFELIIKRLPRVALSLALMVLFAVVSLTSTFSLLLVTERSTGSKHAQRVAGLHLAPFWLSALLWDLLNFLLACAALLAALGASEAFAGYRGARLAEALLILALYGWAVVPLVYLLSFLFQNAGTAYTCLAALNAITGAVTLFLGYLWDKMVYIPEAAVHLQWLEDLNTMFLLIPNYCLGRSFMWLYRNYKATSICASSPAMYQCKEPVLASLMSKNYLSMYRPGVGRFLVSLSVQGAVFMALVFVVETQSAWTLRHFLGSLLRSRRVAQQRPTEEAVGDSASSPPEEEDADVAAERARVQECGWPDVESVAGGGGGPLILRELSKVYGRMGTAPAVDRLSLAVGRGECFGLLGFNGAGKTSTFKMLTGEATITSGDAYIGGYSVRSTVGKTRRHAGYCPQSNTTLLEHMTGRETLRMYARLRGIPEGARASTCVRAVLRRLLLERHADMLVAAYSGGTKRKLSAGVALIGGPLVVLLDEPSAGMDPVAKRLLWNAMVGVRDSSKALVLTTHDMEECEALCTRVGVMVGGRLRCLGSSQHIKSRFGGSYSLQAKVARYGEVEVSGAEEEKESNLQRFKRFMESTFPGCTLKDEHQGMVHYHLSGEAVTLARVFGTMEAAKEKYNVEDYGVSQISLEQVFVDLAQVREEHTDGGQDSIEDV